MRAVGAGAQGPCRMGPQKPIAKPSFLLFPPLPTAPSILRWDAALTESKSPQCLEKKWFAADSEVIWKSQPLPVSPSSEVVSSLASPTRTISSLPAPTEIRVALLGVRQPQLPAAFGLGTDEEALSANVHPARRVFTAKWIWKGVLRSNLRDLSACFWVVC